MLPGLGKSRVVSDSEEFNLVFGSLSARFRGYRISCSETREVGVLHDVEYSKGDCHVYLTRQGIAKYTDVKSTYKWLTVPNLKKITLTGPGWGAACFGAVGMFLTLHGDSEASLMLAKRLNGFTHRYKGV